MRPSPHYIATLYFDAKSLQMATKPVAGKEGVEAEGPAVHRIRITLTSKNVKNLEKGEKSIQRSFQRTLLSCEENHRDR